MKTPKIGITVSQYKQANGQKAVLIPDAYTNAIRNAGGLPLLIPNEFPLEKLGELRQVFDGVLIPGGGDIDPAIYHGRMHSKVGSIITARDELEKALVELAVSTDWPLLAICRGHQMLNIALGGTLYTHIPDEFSTSIRHDQPSSADPGFLAHEVEILSGTNLATILGRSNTRVNSRHHQAIKDLAPTLAVTARASDGLIEAVELPGQRFCLGVQWHPESLQELPEQRVLFSSFIAAARG